MDSLTAVVLVIGLGAIAAVLLIQRQSSSPSQPDAKVWRLPRPRPPLSTVLQAVAVIVIVAALAASTLEERLSINVTAETLVLVFLLLVAVSVERLEQLSWGSLKSSFSTKVERLTENVGGAGEEQGEALGMLDPSEDQELLTAEVKLGEKLAELVGAFAGDRDALIGARPETLVGRLEHDGLLSRQQADKVIAAIDLLAEGRRSRRELSAKERAQAIRLSEALCAKLRTWVIEAATRKQAELSGWTVATIFDAKRAARGWGLDLLASRSDKPGGRVLLAPKAATARDSSLLDGAVKRVKREFAERKDQQGIVAALIVLGDDSNSAPTNAIASDADVEIVKLAELSSKLDAIAASLTGPAA